jgi:2-methylisocitrate lyase-like PEP mutase family enzyme
MPTQAQKGTTFRALHQRDRAFIIPNPWDIGTARLLESPQLVHSEMPGCDEEPTL